MWPFIRVVGATQLDVNNLKAEHIREEEELCHLLNEVGISNWAPRAGEIWGSSKRSLREMIRVAITNILTQRETIADQRSRLDELRLQLDKKPKGRVSK